MARDEPPSADDLAVRHTERETVLRPFTPLEEGEPFLVPAGTPIPPPGTMVVDGRLRIRLAPEYGVEMPICPLAEDSVVIRLLPPDILERIREWETLFNDNFHCETGWRSASTMRVWAERAMRIERELRSALEGKVEVVADLWPLAGEPHDLVLRLDKWVVEDGQVPSPMPGLSIVGALELWCWGVEVDFHRVSGLAKRDLPDPPGRSRPVYEVTGEVVTADRDSAFLDVHGLVLYVHGPEGTFPDISEPPGSYRVIGTLGYAPQGTGAYWPAGRATIKSWKIDAVLEDDQHSCVLRVH